MLVFEGKQGKDNFLNVTIVINSNAKTQKGKNKKI